MRARWSEDEPCLWAIAVGYGYFLGMAAAASLLWLQGTLVGSLNPFLITGLFFSSCLFLLWRGAAAFSFTSPFRMRRELTFADAFAASLLLILIVRVGSLAIEMGQNGLDHGWDAASTWMYRARVWVETGRLVAFVSPAEWLAAPEASSYALAASQYPPLISLIAALPSLAYGDWQESWSSIPWLFAYVALGLALYGQCRAWRTPTQIALLVVWLVLSLPLLGSQVAVPGYADLWMAACLSLALISFLGWIRDRDRLQGLLSILMIVITISVKTEGIIWALLFVPALVAARWSAKGLVILTSSLAVLLAVVAIWGPFEIHIPALGRFAVSIVGLATDFTGPIELVRQQDVGRPLLVHLFVFGSMHLLGLAVLIGLVAQSLPAVLGESRVDSAPWRRAGVTWILTVCSALYLLFFWTAVGEWVRQGTSVNRLILQAAPAFVFWCHLVVMDSISQSRLKSLLDEETKTDQEGEPDGH